MARSTQSKLLIAHCIAWGGAMAACLIATYGPHGPAVHPKLLLICLMPLAVMSVSGLWSKSSPAVAIAHVVLWLTAAGTAFTLANTSLGDGVPTIAMTVVLLVLGLISLAILASAKMKHEDVDQTEND